MPDVSTQNLAYGRMAKQWDLVNALMGGTPKMRAAGTDYLPQFPRESREAYEARLESTFLYPGFAEAVDGAVSRIFSKQLTVEGSDLSKAIEDDCDLEGTDLNGFVSDTAKHSIAKGHGFIYVDMPENEGGLRLDQERARGIRPYFQFIGADSVIFFKFAKTKNKDGSEGPRKLVHIRIEQKVIEEDGMWGEKEVTQILVLEPGLWQVWRQDSKKKAWSLHKEGSTTLDYIPLVPLYIDRVADFESRPPFYDLAWKNVEHWQSSSDQRNILHVSRFPVWFGAGFETDSNDIAFGPHLAIMQSNPDAKFEPKEPKGNGIEHGRKDLEELKQEMELLAKKPLMQKHSNKTATEVQRDDGQATTSIKQWALSIKDAVTRALQVAHDYMGEPFDAVVDINTDFDIALSSDEMALLQKMEMAGQITKQTLWDEAKRRNLLSSDFNAEEEKVLLEEQAPQFVDDPLTEALNNAVQGA